MGVAAAREHAWLSGEAGRKAAHVGLELRASPAAVRAGRTDARGRGGGTSAVQETARRSVVVTEPRGALRVCSSVALREQCGGCITGLCAPSSSAHLTRCWPT